MAELWGDAPPATAAKSIQVYVSRLRKELGADRLITRPPGYVLRVDAVGARPGPVRAPARGGQARGADRRGAQAARGARAVARAGALADLAYEPFVQAEIARLEELRLVDARGADRRRPRRRPARGPGRRARGAGRRAPAARAAARPADARALPLGSPGRGAARLPGGAARAGRRARARAERGAASGSSRRSSSRTRRSIQRAAAAAEQAGAHGRAVLAFAAALDGLDALLALAAPLAAARPARAHRRCVVAPSEVGAATAALAERADELRDGGLAARARRSRRRRRVPTSRGSPARRASTWCSWMLAARRWRARLG